MQADPPLIVTLTLDEASQVYFTQLRNQYFPKHCNFLQAHLTLFHHLPSNNDEIDECLQQSTQRSIMNLDVVAIKNFGNGNAFAISSLELQQLHTLLQQSFSKYLISRDRNKLWPHITLQNKVTAFKAAETNKLLEAGFKPFSIKAIGIDTWLYMNGPWQHKNSFPFINLAA